VSQPGPRRQREVSFTEGGGLLLFARTEKCGEHVFPEQKSSLLPSSQKPFSNSQREPIFNNFQQFSRECIATNAKTQSLSIPYKLNKESDIGTTI
jgi:hypothetical protein